MDTDRILWTDGREVDAYVDHVARSKSDSLRASSLYEDYCPPLISHRLDVVARCEGDGICPGCARGRCEGAARVARLVVNEFPVHMVEDYGGEVFWLFDMCDQGPSAIPGQMIDVLADEGVIRLIPGEGAILHLQNLEVRSDLHRRRIGTRLIGYAAALLGRSDADLLVCELQPVRCLYDPLFPDDDDASRVRWLPHDQLHRFLRRVGFSRWQLTGDDPRRRLPDRADGDVVCYFKVVDSAARARLLGG